MGKRFLSKQLDIAMCKDMNAGIDIGSELVSTLMLAADPNQKSRTKTPFEQAINPKGRLDFVQMMYPKTNEAQRNMGIFLSLDTLLSHTINPHTSRFAEIFDYLLNKGMPIIDLNQ